MPALPDHPTPRWLAAAAVGLSIAFPVAAADDLASAIAEVRQVPVVYTVDGTIEAVRQATVAAQVPGRVVDMRVDAGRAVNQGDVIARIDAEEATQAVASGAARIVEAEAALGNARVNLERTGKLVADRFVSPAALDKARADHDAARAAVDALRASTRQLETARQYAIVTAPMTGVVGARLIEAGDLAQPGRAIASIFDPRGLRVVVSVPQQRVAAIRQSGVASIEVPGREGPLTARAVEVLPMADARTHTSDVRVLLPVGAGGVYPGMSARVHFSIGQAERLVIPPAAVVRRSEVTGVHVIANDGTIQFRQVRLGVAAGPTAVEVLAGIRPGERVATEPQRALQRSREARGK